MVDDDYEIISQRELKRLKSEVGALKQSGSAETGKLQEAIEDLTKRLDSMIDVFEAAAEDMREEDKESDLISKKIDPIFERLTQMEEQNRKIADGLIAINSIVDEKLAEITDLAEALNRQQNDLIEKLNNVMDEISDMHKSGAMSSQSMQSIPSFPEPRMPSSDLPPLPSAGIPRLESSARKKGFHLF